VTVAGLVGLAAILILPLAGLGLLLGVPELDVRWEHHPAHFWLVMAASAINGVLAYGTGDAARRRGDARIFLVSLAFLASAGFLFLHALATPGVFLDTSNTGFVVATPFGLTVAALLLAASATGPVAASPAWMRSSSRLRIALLVGMGAWAAASLAEVPPLDGPPLERGSAPLVMLAALALAGFAVAGAGYMGDYLRRPSRLVAAVVAACVLLGQAMVAVAFARSWHLSWWEWHALVLAAFAVVALSARSEWRDERYVALYGPDTAGGTREISVLFADLEGFTPFSEKHDPSEVSEMLNAVFEAAIPPVVARHGGVVDQITGDAVMVTFNARGDQPDHARRALDAALEIRTAGSRISQEHPGWPRLRIGVNSGPARVGVVGASGGRTYTVIGDSVNVAARLQQSAPTGEALIGAATLEKVTGVEVQSVPDLVVKGKSEPVKAYVLVGRSDDGESERPG
jgi:adenylate cyclase